MSEENLLRLSRFTVTERLPIEITADRSIRYGWSLIDLRLALKWLCLEGLAREVYSRALHQLRREEIQCLFHFGAGTKLANNNNNLIRQWLLELCMQAFECTMERIRI